MAIEIQRTGHCIQVVPAFIDGSEREASVSERWKGSTIAFRMTREQAFELAAILLVVTQQASAGHKISVTVHRDQKSSEDMFPIQVHAVP